MLSQKVKLSSIKVNKKNPRKIDKMQFDSLVKSILVFPKMLNDLRPIVVDENMTILGGNMRYRALVAISTMTADDCRNRMSLAKNFNKKTSAEKAEIEKYWVEWRKAPIVDVVKADNLDEEAKKEFVIKDNVSFGEWDNEILKAEFNLDDLQDFGLDLPEFADEKVEEEAEEDDFSEKDAKNAPTRCIYGDIWRLGNHRLMCGDSTKTEDVARLMDGIKADLLFTDPPYGLHKGSEKGGIINDNKNLSELLEFNKRWVPLSFDAIKKNGSWYCWGTTEPLFDIYAEILKPMIRKREIVFRTLITWLKESTQGQLSEGFTQYPPLGNEKCLFVMKGAANLSSGVFRTKEFFFEGFKPIRDYLVSELKKSGLTIKKVIQLTSSYASHYFAESQWAFPTEKDYNAIQRACSCNAFQKPYAELQKKHAELLPYFNNTHAKLSDVWSINRTSNAERADTDNHPTPKPIALCAIAIKTSSRSGEVVLDLFGGSGSTLIACEQLNRKCYTMELDPHYCDVILARWEKLTGQKAEKLED